MEVLLLKVRNEKDVTLKELSLRTGISKSALQRIESGEVSPTLEKLEIIAKALGVRVTDLFKEWNFYYTSNLWSCLSKITSTKNFPAERETFIKIIPFLEILYYNPSSRKIILQYNTTKNKKLSILVSFIDWTFVLYYNQGSLLSRIHLARRYYMGEGNIEKNTLEEMTNEDYREELEKMFISIDDNRLLRYFYIFVSEKLKRVLW